MTGRHTASGEGANGITRTHEVLGRRTLVFGLAGLLVVTSAAAVLIARGQPASSCSGHETIEVTAAPSIAVVLKKAGAAWESKARPTRVCPVLHVTSRSSAEAVARLGRPDVDPPDVWIPDSSLWVQQLRRDTNGESTPVHSSWVSPSIASSPMVLAANLTDARAMVKPAHEGWSKVLAGQTDVSTLDPERTTEGLLTLATAQATLGQGSGPPTPDLVTSLVTLSTHIVEPGPGGGETPPLPTSEQTVIEANLRQGPDQLQAVYPQGEGMSLDFPVVQFVPSTQAPVRREAVSAFVSSLYRPATQRSLRAVGLRDAKGRAFPSTVDFDGIAPTASFKSLPPLSDQQVTDSRRVWSAAKRRNRTLIVVDVSGSMTEGRGEKIRLAAAAVKDAVGYLPDDAELGLWAFSTNLNGSSPWRQLVSLGRIGSPDDPQASRQTLRSQADQLPRLARSRGDTGLYRTTWDAFHTVRNRYSQGRYNSVVLVTDGADTGSGLTRDALLSRLKSADAPSRPLPIFTVAIGPDADQQTLKAISAATGGSEYAVDAVSDIREVFLDAVIKEGT